MTKIISAVLVALLGANLCLAQTITKTGRGVRASSQAMDIEVMFYPQKSSG